MCPSNVEAVTASSFVSAFTASRYGMVLEYRDRMKLRIYVAARQKSLYVLFVLVVNLGSLEK